MEEDPDGDYVRLSEIEPLVQKAVDHAKAEELRKARERIAELEDDVKRLLGCVDAFEGLCRQYPKRDIATARKLLLPADIDRGEIVGLVDRGEIVGLVDRDEIVGLVDRDGITGGAAVRLPTEGEKP